MISERDINDLSWAILDTKSATVQKPQIHKIMIRKYVADFVSKFYKNGKTKKDKWITNYYRICIRFIVIEKSNTIKTWIIIKKYWLVIEIFKLQLSLIYHYSSGQFIKPEKNIFTKKSLNSVTLYPNEGLKIFRRIIILILEALFSVFLIFEII